jgi:hypothetical protein
MPQEEKMVTLTLRRLTLALAMAAFAASIFFHPLKPAYACSCMMPGPPEQALNESQAVFSGTVKAVQGDADGVLVTFDVDEIWKGPEGAELTLFTPGSSAACGVEFVQGEAYLVYGMSQEGRLSTNLCSRTTQLGSAGEDLAALGAGNPAPAGEVAPAPEVSVETSLPWVPIAIGAGVVGVAAVALFALRRRG